MPRRAKLTFAEDGQDELRMKLEEFSEELQMVARSFARADGQDSVVRKHVDEANRILLRRRGRRAMRLAFVGKVSNVGLGVSATMFLSEMSQNWTAGSIAWGIVTLIAFTFFIASELSQNAL